MSFIRRKKTRSGKIYAYEVTASWDAVKRQSRSISKYVGVVGADGEIIPKGASLKGRPKQQAPKSPEEKMILDFGDGFLVTQSIKNSAIYEPLEEVFKSFPELLVLMAYRICQPGPMYNAHLWIEGNMVKTLEGSSSLSSQHISRLLAHLGQESLQRAFFEKYLHPKDKQGPQNVIIDATSLPNQINSDFNAWGYNDGGIDQQFRFHCVVDQLTKKPLFYRYVPGNIADISTLRATLQELKALGVKQSFALVDAGYCSAENIGLLRESQIDFLMRLPASRRLYKEMIQTHAKELDAFSHMVPYGKRSLCVKSIQVENLYGQIGYLHMILDHHRKAKDINKLTHERANQSPEDKDDLKDQYDFLQAGVFMLISSKPIPSQEVLGAYYSRQSIEQIFGFAKDDLDLLPLRCHSENTIRGYLFLQFLLLIVFIELREKLKDLCTVEQALISTKALKCKVYPHCTIVQELQKLHKKIFNASSIIVPTNTMGI